MLCLNILALRSHLEVEDPGVLLAEALTMRNHAVQQPFIKCQRTDGSKKPAVAWNRGLCHHANANFRLKHFQVFILDACFDVTVGDEPK